MAKIMLIFVIASSAPTLFFQSRSECCRERHAVSGT